MNPRAMTTHIDDRGSLTEMLDPRWGWSDDPIVYAYNCTIRPGVVKGWALHLKHQDRYFLVRGELELVLFDVRPQSRTYGQICKFYLSEKKPQIINIPTHVWHADRNIGDVDAMIINFPTIPYDHEKPDKLRLPLDTPLIPHNFGDAVGW
ncbi:MAG TPA: hypothetical protein ENJ42_03610 [Hellea balneolensis]|uniref:dTDP-4-dehydrorhamnose 3,5-epimerase n=1 Tax=Hellea balneolensis TaxID=287478 RepID=A0A7C5QP16_9PROT|nr:hypothetical protein [Hellea balneolensis]